MSNPTDDSARPAKRARLDTSATFTLSDTSAPAPRAAPADPKAPVPTAVDADLEREVRAGITDYVCPDNLGFTGVLKQRYTDFLVNEIGLDGRVLHLASLGGERKESERQNGNAANGAGQETTEAKVGEEHVKVEIKEEASVQNGGVVKKETAKTQHTPDREEKKETQTNGQSEAVKSEPEEPLAEEDFNTLNSIFGETTTKQIITLVRQVRRREHKKAKDFKAVIAPPITDKEQRTQAHQSLRRIFPNLLESAMEVDQSIRIKATPPAERKGKNKGKGGNRDRSDADQGKRGGQLWQELGGDYLHFTLYKENKDTMEVVGFLGSKLNCGSKGFSFAGTKDRRACTTQRVCVKRQTAGRLHGFNKMLFNAAIGDFAHHKHDLKLGDLMGNEFTITLRDCHFQSEENVNAEERLQLAKRVVSKAIQDFSDKGFINYYGLQRFGSFAASTDAIGRKMLQDDLKGAVEDLLAYSEVALAVAEGTYIDSDVLVSQDDQNRARALHLWKSEGSGNAAMDLLPRKFNAERNIIQHLNSRNSRTGQHDRLADWQGALMTIPRNLRLMYVHAYQSLVWNTVAGKRWVTFGDKVVEGDLVLVNEHRDKVGSIKSERKETIDQNGEVIIDPTGSENANATGPDFERARALTASEVASGKYTIWDVVLPQPGYDVEYPKNTIGEFYKEFMGSEKGGGLNPYNMRRPWREVSLSGGYRKFLSRPLQPLTFEVHEYTKEDEQFVETDLQRLNKGESGGKEDVQMEDGEEEEVRAKKLAVVLKLQLASSQYATMALRELMKAGGVKAFKPEYSGR